MHGSGKSLLNIVSYIIKDEFNVTVIVPTDKGALVDLLRKRQIPYIVLGVVISVYPKFNTKKDFIRFPYRILKLIAKKVRFFVQLNSFVKKAKPDIIHTNVGVIHTAHSVAKKNKIPHVWHLREYQDRNFGYKPFPSKRRLIRKLSHSNNYIIANTKGVYDHFLLSEKNAKVVYNGFIIDKIPSINIKKINYLLYVGAVTKQKGVEEAIKAFSQVSSQIPSTELWIVGAGNKDYLHYLKSTFLCHENIKRIKFLGHRSDVYDFMHEAKALIVPSLHEGFGLITVEAMLNGCLVIGNDTAGTKEQFDNGVRLFNQEIGIRYNTTQELGKYMIEVCNNDPIYYLSQLETAQKTVLKLYDVKKYVSEVKKVYSDLINNTNSKQLDKQ